MVSECCKDAGTRKFERQPLQSTIYTVANKNNDGQMMGLQKFQMVACQLNNLEG